MLAVLFVSLKFTKIHGYPLFIVYSYEFEICVILLLKFFSTFTRTLNYNNGYYRLPVYNLRKFVLASFRTVVFTV